jgi:hypothetical protein
VDPSPNQPAKPVAPGLWKSQVAPQILFAFSARLIQLEGIPPLAISWIPEYWASCVMDRQSGVIAGPVGFRHWSLP